MSVITSRGKKLAFKAILFTSLVIGIEALSVVAIDLFQSTFGREIRRTDDIFKEQSDRIRAFIDPKSTRREVFDPTLLQF